MSQIFAGWAGKSLNQSENHSFSQAPSETNLAENSFKPSLHWNNKDLLSGPFILYGVAYQKADHDIMKQQSQPLKGGPHSFKKGLF